MPGPRLSLASVACAALLATACGGNSNRIPGQAGDEAVAKKDFQRAAVEYRIDVRANPKSSELRRKLAQAYERAGNVRAAVTEYVRVADLLPNDPQAQLDAAGRLLLTRQFEDARTRAEAVLKTDPKNLQAHIIRGNSMAGLGDAEEAVVDLRNLLKTEAPTTESLMTLGGLEVRRGQAQQAEAAFKQAIVVGGNNPNAHIALANYYRAVGRYRDAEPALKKALELDPKNIIANRLLALLYLASGRAAAAEAPLKAVVEYAGTPEAELSLADYYVAQGRDKDALVVLRKLTGVRAGWHGSPGSHRRHRLQAGARRAGAQDRGRPARQGSRERAAPGGAGRRGSRWKTRWTTPSARPTRRCAPTTTPRRPTHCWARRTSARGTWPKRSSSTSR